MKFEFGRGDDVRYCRLLEMKENFNAATANHYIPTVTGNLMMYGGDEGKY